MQIGLARPFYPGSYCAQSGKPVEAANPTDGFQSGFSVEALDHTASMAALARSVKSNLRKAQLPADLAVVVETQLGDAAILNIREPRVQQLYRFFVDGIDSPAFDPLKVLGEGWELQESSHPAGDGDLTFSRFGDTVIQHLSFDAKSGSTRLLTIHNESFLSTRHLAIEQTKDGSLVVVDETFPVSYAISSRS